MRITLVYPPFARPMFPPCGIAQLKGFIKKQMPEINVKCLDLNLNWHQEKIIKNKLFEEKTFFKIGKKKYIDYSEKIKNIDEELLTQFIEGKISEKKIKNKLHKDIVKIMILKPNIIGFSILLKSQIIYALALSKLIKKKYEINIIFGGALFTWHAFADAEKLIYPLKLIDVIVRGEGEYALLDILKKYYNEKKITNLNPNLFVSYYDREKQKMIINKKPVKKISGIKKIDFKNFPDYGDFKLSDYFTPKIFLPIRLAWGCTWGKCAFCVPFKNKPFLICRPTKSVIAELKALNEEFGVSNFYFQAAETPKFLMEELAEEIIKSNLKIYYSLYARPIASLDLKLLKKMHKSGCRLIHYGVESFSQRILNLMEKGTNVNDIIKILKLTKIAGIKTFCWYMIGFPSHTRKEIVEELKIIKKNYRNIDYLSVSTFFLKKRSKIYYNKKLINSFENKGTKIIKINNCAVFHDEKILFKVKSGISSEKVEKWAKKFRKEFSLLKPNLSFNQSFSDYKEAFILSNLE